MLTNEQKINMLKKVKDMGDKDKWEAIQFVNALDSAPADLDLKAEVRRIRLDKAVQLMRDRWMYGMTIRFVEATTGFHARTIYREIDRRGLPRSSDPSQPEIYKGKKY